MLAGLRDGAPGKSKRSPTRLAESKPVSQSANPIEHYRNKLRKLSDCTGDI